MEWEFILYLNVLTVFHMLLGYNGDDCHKLSLWKHTDITGTPWFIDNTNIKRHNQVNRRIILPNEKHVSVKGTHIWFYS